MEKSPFRPNRETWLQSNQIVLRQTLTFLEVPDEHWHEFGEFVFSEPERVRKFNIGHIEQGTTEQGFRIAYAQEFIKTRNLWTTD